LTTRDGSRRAQTSSCIAGAAARARARQHAGRIRWNIRLLLWVGDRRSAGKDYRVDGTSRWKTMRLHPHEFIRRFLIRVLPKGFHRIRHYGLFANASRAEDRC
jgi:hypothetical protein